MDKWVLSDFLVERLIPIVGVRPFPLDELMLLAGAVCRIKPTHIFEWGTNIGKSARVFHEVSAAFGVDCEIHSIDLPDDADHGEHPRSEHARLVRGISRVRLHRGDGVSVALSLAETAGADARPLFFLDGDHSYESVARELREVDARTTRAHILVHDTFHQSAESGYNVGPRRAIDEFIPRAARRYDRLDTQLGLPGMTLLWNRLGLP